MSEEVWNDIEEKLDATVDVSPGVSFSTLISRFENGAEQRRRKTINSRRSFGLSYDIVTREQMNAMRAFFEARYGAFDNFLFEHKAESPIPESEFVATAPGTTNIFSLDHENIIPLSEAITKAGLPQTRNVDYTINDPAGTIEFVSTPGAGATIYATTYRFRYRVRFGDDGFQAESLHRSDAYRVNVNFVTEVDQ